MKVAYVVQRYGEEIAGGAESATRFLAEQLAGRGHEVHVLTSCARSYVDWADWYPPGDTRLNGVEVHRLPVEHARDNAHFSGMHQRVVMQSRQSPLSMQRAWAREHGPELVDFERALVDVARRVDVVVFYAYLFAPTVLGIPLASAVAPVAFHPALHDEMAARLPVMDATFRLADGTFFHTIEEAEVLVGRTTRLPSVSRVLGLGVAEPPANSADRARARFGLGTAPYLVSVGRVDAGKGSLELAEHFAELRRRCDTDVRLVFVGEDVAGMGARDGVVVTGFVDEQTKHDLLAGAAAFVQPSYFESFSLVLVEAWLHGLPALVQGRNPVLVGQIRRSAGGIAYHGFASFENSVHQLLADPGLAARAGAAGRAYAHTQYAVSTMIDRYEEFLGATIDAGRRRLHAA